MKKKSIPLVGRTTEQRLLESFLTETRRGELSCAVITGAPGSGCSALLNWFISHAQEFVVINCALEPSAKITPFAAIRMIIEQALNIYSALDIGKKTMLRGRLEPLINQVPGLLEYIHPGLHKHFWLFRK